ncbi:alpha/beta fold hydrolase [Agromyces sp. LHK192]|uniref:alpha/beta fold hydrolase n=1 Tax=Agromyces sp. LHK192 TaxID=2498704 RepID=UPI0013E2BB93|nr:alpha/beta fold hydrolase [Agromyces sp. LHK192]
MPRIGAFRDDPARARYLVAYDAALATMPQTTAVSEVDTALGTVHACTWAGDLGGPPVLLLPGITSGIPMWADNLPALLESGRTIIAVDALGDAGRSVQRAPMTSMDDQARWLVEALDGLGAERVHAVGHSFGGATAAALAVREPQRIASLSLLEPVFTFAWPPPATFWWATIATLPVPTAWREHALAALGGVDVEEVRAQSPVGTLVAVASETFRSALPTPRPLGDAQLARLTMPTYVAIGGGRSLAGGRRAAARARAGIPTAEVELWPDAGHSLPMQHPAEIAERLERLWARG